MRSRFKLSFNKLNNKSLLPPPHPLLRQLSMKRADYQPLSLEKAQKLSITCDLSDESDMRSVSQLYDQEFEFDSLFDQFK